jgi:SPX domain protein involved in polyphosphate accumulation
MKDYEILRKNRFERKFVIEGQTFEEIHQRIKLHPALFSSIYHERYINNIYFDMPAMDFYHDNISGKSERLKVRIRWYGDLFQQIKDPVLELKIKHGAIGDKKSYPLQSFSFSKEIRTDFLQRIFRSSSLPEDVLGLVLQTKPTLVNRYQRVYYKDVSKQFRITVDRSIEYYRINPIFNSFLQRKSEDNFTSILELKYDYDIDDQASKITSHLPYRLTKNSKYVNGIESFYTMAY